MTVREVLAARVEFEQGSAHKAIRVGLHPEDFAAVKASRDWLRLVSIDPASGGGSPFTVAGMEWCSDPDAGRGEVRFSHVR